MRMPKVHANRAAQQEVGKYQVGRQAHTTQCNRICVHCQYVYVCIQIHLDIFMRVHTLNGCLDIFDGIKFPTFPSSQR